jgi:EAL domain-containing protein (putative c-di-GMP-specific phosphodiesterase class I)
VALWRRSDPSLSVSVNIAAAVLSGDGFAERVQEALDRHCLPPDALILEITESETLAEERGAQDAVLRLAAAGIMLSIDDFGTGYSALSYLQNLPVGEVKIDRSFVARMAEHPGDRTIVTGTIQLLHSLGLQVVAEGVETVAVWDLLAELGCHAAQGFLMSRPLCPEDAAAWAVSPGWSLEKILSR